MSLVLLVILLLILLVRVGSDKASSMEYKRVYAEEKAERDEWLSHVVDRALENDLRRALDDPSCADRVNLEIGEALSEMGDAVPWVSKDEKLDILLANRGKISSLVEMCGEWTACHYRTKPGKYGVEVYDKDGEIRKAELMKWLRDTLRENGLSLELWRCEGRYYWEGSYGFNNHVRDISQCDDDANKEHPFLPVDKWEAKRARPSV